MTEKTTWRERRFRKIIASLDGKILNADDLTGGRAPSGLFCLWGGQIGKLLDNDWRPTRAGLHFRRLIHKDGNSYEWRHTIMVVSNEEWTSVTP